MAAGKPKREKWPRIILLVPAAVRTSAPAHLFIRDATGQAHEIRVYLEWMEKIFVPSAHTMEERSLESIRARFNRLYGEFYSMLLDDPAKESGIDADFTPVVTESGHDQSVYNLSGGEKTSIVRACRLTLAKMVLEDSGMEAGLLMLDESTDGFPQSQLEKVRTVLDEAGVTQAILVSHDAELESYADRIYRVLKSDRKPQIAT